MKDEKTYKIIGCAMEVHKELGCGFLEAVYQEALGREFGLQGVPNEAQPVIEISYKGEPLEKKYEPDYVCYGEVIVEIKAISGLSGVEEAQLINYLKATGLEVGLLINFGTPSLEYKRFVYGPLHRLRRWTQIRENKSGDHMEGVAEVQAPYDPQMTPVPSAKTTADKPSGATGQAEVDPNVGQGKTSVKSVKSVDDVAWKSWSRLEVSSVVEKGRHFSFKRPLSLDVTFDVDEKEFVLEFPDLNIFLSAYTPEELYKAFCEDILWLWEEYGACEERDLSEDGRRLRRRVLELVEAE